MEVLNTTDVLSMGFLNLCLGHFRLGKGFITIQVQSIHLIYRLKIAENVLKKASILLTFLGGHAPRLP